jgi:hypothetical protein
MPQKSEAEAANDNGNGTLQIEDLSVARHQHQTPNKLK